MSYNLIPAIQMFTVREFIQTPEGLYDSLKKVREMGCRDVQFSRVGQGIDPDYITSVLKELDMHVFVTHSPMNRIFNDLPALIREHHAWGCDSIGLGNLDNSYLDDGYEGYTRFIRDIKPVTDELKKEGMTFAYHSHCFEFIRYQGELMYDRLIRETDPETFHFIQDSFWMRYGGINHKHFMKKVAGRMEVLHVKDFTTRTGYFGECECMTGTLGEGNIDYKPLLKTCEDIGVKYLAIEQDRCLRDPFDCLRDAYAELKRIVEEE